MGLRAFLAQIIADATATGRAILTGTPAQGRTALELGTSAVRDDSYFAVADTHNHTVINLDGTSVIDMDGNGNLRLTTATGKGIVLAPLNDVVSIIRGTLQPQMLQIANTWSASDDFELLRIAAANTEYRIGSVAGANDGACKPVSFGYWDPFSNAWVPSLRINTDETVTFYGPVTLPSGSSIPGYQPLDSDLTAIAALTTTSFGRGALELADQAAFRTYIGAGSSSFDGAFSSLSGKPTSVSGYGITDAYTKTEVDSLVAGLLELKADLDCSTNPNYPAASKADAYYVTVAGKVGGGSGVSVEVGDLIVAKANNAGGTQASVGSSWFVLEHNIVGALMASNNLSDLANAGTARTNLGLGTLATQNGTISDYLTIVTAASTYALTSHTHTLSNLTQSGATANQFPQWNGSAWVPVTITVGSGDALTSGTLGQFASTSSAILRGVISDETGTGFLVFNNAPALVSPTMDLITLTERLGSEMVVDGAFAAPTQFTCATAGVNITNDTFTLSGNPGWAVNDCVQYFNGGGASATGMTHRGFYFIESYAAGVISVKTTTGGAKLNITGTGNNAQFFIKTNWFAGTSGTTGGIDGWDLSGGTASHQVAGTPTLRPAVALAPTPGQLYKIQYTVSNWTVAGTTIVFGGVTAQAATAPTANGTRTLYVTALTNGDLSLVPITGMRADIDDLSIKPVLSGVAASAIPVNFTETLSDAIANEVAYAFNYTVNKVGQGNDVGVAINMLDTSSPGTSLCFQINVNGSSQFSINNAGAVTCGTVTCSSITASQTFSTSSVFTSSYAGAASTAAIRTTGAIFTGGTGTTNFPQWLQQPTAATAATTWSVNGTWWGVNTATGFTGNFVDLHVNGAASVFVVDYTGKVTATGNIFTSISSVTQRALVHAPTWNAYSPAGGTTATLLLSETGSNIHNVARPTSGNITIAFSGDAANQVFVLILTTSSSGTPGTVTLPAGITWLTNAGAAPTLSTAINKTDSIMFMRTGAGAYLAWHTGQN